MTPIPGDMFSGRGGGSNFGFGSGKSLPKQRALKAQFGISEQAPVPTSLLRQIVQTPIGGQVGGVVIDTKTKYRANFALNVSKRG